MLQSHIGELAALAVAFAWTITAMAFEHASKHVGSLNVNLYRMPLAFIFLCMFTFFFRNNALPTDASAHQWIWLTFSGLVGFVIGDLFLFKAYIYIGSRFSMLVMTTVPPMTAMMGWLVFNEKLTIFSFLGMVLTILGIVLAVNTHKDAETKQFSKNSLKGILFAFVGAMGQSGGLILSKIGMQNYNAFASSQIRIIAGTIGFVTILIFLKRIKQGFKVLSNKEGMKGILLGSFFGPFIGVSLSLYAVQHAQTGIASTIMSIVPILIIVPSVFIFKQKITLIEIAGSFICVAGVALFFV
jgi:drug/metabolite transporter (DMT)-like permease